MCSRKSRGQSMGPWRTPALTGYCCEDFSSRTTQSHLSLRKEENFALSDAEHNTTGLLSRGGITDLLLLKTLLAIHQKSREPSFWKVIDSFVLLVYSSLAALRALLHWLLACLNFTLDSEDLFCWYKQKSDFYELW